MERKKISVKLVIVSSDSWRWPPSDARKFLEWFEERLKDIPYEYRDSAKIEIESLAFPSDEKDCLGVTSAFSELTISYSRHETDDELRERENREKVIAKLDREQEHREDHQERIERMMLAELKSKYES